MSIVKWDGTQVDLNRADDPAGFALKVVHFGLLGISVGESTRHRYLAHTKASYARINNAVRKRSRSNFCFVGEARAYQPKHLIYPRLVKRSVNLLRASCLNYESAPGSWRTC